MSQSPISRRSVVAGGVAAASARLVLGASDRIRLGAIGTGNRGRYLMRKAIAAGDIEFVAVADAYDVQRDKAEAVAGKKLDQYADYRKVLDHQDIDAVIIATWDHMHHKIAVDACRAGKDIYLEKPMTLHPMEGHDIVRAVRQHRRIAQIGTQQRSHPHFQEAKEKFVDSGRLGRVTMVRTFWNANRAYQNIKPPPGMKNKPAGLDWDLCQGVLPKIPWDAKRYFNHYVYWDYSTNAQMGGLFVHLVDVVHWYLNIERPLAATAMGGIYLTEEGRDTADNINAILEYPGKINVTFEATVANLLTDERADIVFMGEGGRLHIFRQGYRFVPVDAGGAGGEVTAGPTEDLHVANWLDCVRGRKQPNVDEVAGHYSAMACHIANMSYKEKRLVSWQKEWGV